MRKSFAQAAALAAIIISTPILAAAQDGSSTGPKKRIAVTKFDATGAFVAQYGGWDIGGGLAAQLITELTKTERFIVVERSELGAALREQQLGMMGVASPETTARPGQVVGAQLLIHGSVTEFDQTAAGKGMQVGVGIFGARVGVGANKTTGRVTIDLRIIDATTGQIISSDRADAEVSQRGINADITGPGFAIGNGAFDRTVLGRASRDAIARAVGLIVGRAESVAWSGRVVDAGDGAVYINAGADASMRRGQRLMVSTVVKELTDPSTGLPLGVIERRLGEIEIETVSEKFSVARAINKMEVERGDVVRIAGGQADRPSAAPGRNGERKTAPPRDVPRASAQGPSVESLRQAIQDLDMAGNMSAPPSFPMSSAPVTFPSSGIPMGQLPGSAPASQGTTVSGRPAPGPDSGAAPFELPATQQGLPLR
jgi:curli biogenesis system outer membrane secretion channel CsgG